MPSPIYGGSSGGGSGTVTSASVVTANGVSGSVATATTTPAITFTLGAITPTTVNGNTLTTGTWTLTGQAGKTLAFNGSITLTGTDAQTYTFPTTSATIARTDAANIFTGVQTMTSPALTTPAITGLATGSGVASAATASTLAARDANGILTAANFNETSQSVVTAAGTTTLTAASPGTLFLTGTTTQTVVMPSTATLAVNASYVVFNNSTGAVTVQTSVPTTMLTMAGNTAAIFSVISTSGNTPAAWSIDYGAVSVPTGASITIAGPTVARTWTAPDANFTIARTDAANTFTGTQTFGAVVGTTWNGNTWATGTGTLSIAAGKTFTNSNTITLVGTDAQTYTFPTTSATIARTDAAQSFTGVQTFVAPILGTPTSGNLANCTFPTLNQNTTGSAASLSVSGQTGLLTVTGLISTNRIKTVRDAADTVLELGGSYTPTGTWTSLTLVTPVLGTPTSGALTNCTSIPVAQATGLLPDANISGPALTAVPINIGGWLQFKVAGSDATTTGQSLVDVTGLVTGTLSTASAYEFEAVLYCTTTAVVTGTSYGVHVTQAPTNITAIYIGPTTNTAGLQAGAVSATTGDNITSAAFLTTASEDGCIVIKGFLTTGAGASPAFSIRHLKVTSGTSTVKIGSVLRIRKL